MERDRTVETGVVVGFCNVQFILLCSTAIACQGFFRCAGVQLPHPVLCLVVVQGMPHCLAQKKQPRSNTMNPSFVFR